MSTLDSAISLTVQAHWDQKDTNTTKEDLQRAGFNERIISALEKLTHKPDQNYSNYIIELKKDELALQVKLADRKDNSRIDRAYLHPFNLEGGTKKLMKYMASFKFLMDQITDREYQKYMTGQ